MLIYVSIILFTMIRFQGPEVIPVSSPPNVVSGQRAMVEIRSLLDSLEGQPERKHPAGTAENIEVAMRLQNRLRQLGFEVQELPFESPVGTLTNILAHRPGRKTPRPLLFTSHYDSCPFGPGAGDDLSAVGSILEVARASQETRAKEATELWLLFTDGEEKGLWGAKAFADSQYQLGDAKPFIINVDSRGNSGAALMFETHRNNLSVIRKLRHQLASPRFTNSMMLSVKEKLPNDTDFTVFKKFGALGMNIALIGGAENYHTPNDTTENLSVASVQHITNHLHQLLIGIESWSNEDWADLSLEFPAVFFDIWGGPVVVYPEYWNPLLTVLCWALFCAVILRHGKLAKLRIFYFTSLFFTIMVIVVISGLLSYVFRWILFEGGILDRPYVSYGPLLAMVYWLIPCLLCYGIGDYVFGKREPFSARIAMLFWLSFLSTVATLFLPGAAFLFYWLGILLGSISFFETKGEWPDWLIAFLSTILYAPLVILFCHAMGPNGGAILGIAFALLVTPTLLLFSRNRPPIDFLKELEERDTIA